MLVLSRKAGEEIVIGDARVMVVSIRGDRVHLGVTAPRDVLVLRAELEKAERPAPAEAKP